MRDKNGTAIHFPDVGHDQESMVRKATLSNIHLSFYPGAKIGVLGRNGAGKSTLLKIMAGVDTDFDGEAKLTKGFHRRIPFAGTKTRS